MYKTYCGIISIILAFASVSHAQTLTPAAAMRLFHLTSEFEKPVSLQATNGDNAFPWQIINEDGSVLGVVENIVLDSEAQAKYYILDAQLVDGNDLKLAVPLD